MSSQVAGRVVAGSWSAVGMEPGAGAGAKGRGRRRKVWSVKPHLDWWGRFFC